MGTYTDFQSIGFSPMAWILIMSSSGYDKRGTGWAGVIVYGWRNPCKTRAIWDLGSESSLAVLEMEEIAGASPWASWEWI